MATVTLDYSGLDRTVDEIIGVLKDKEAVFRPIAVELLGIMHKRIHEEGLATDGSAIGSYQSNYLRLREKKGLGGDAKVILVFTRKLSNSWQVFATDNGYAVGFVDDGAVGGVATSLEKIRFAEERFGKKILDPTADEQNYIAVRTVEIVGEKLAPYAAT
jgi:hypothetical protein